MGLAGKWPGLVGFETKKEKSCDFSFWYPDPGANRDGSESTGV